MFVTKDPNVVITQIHITPLRDQDNLWNVYTWKEMIVRAYNKPPHSQDEGASKDMLNHSSPTTAHSPPTELPLAFSCAFAEQDVETEHISENCVSESDETEDHCIRETKWPSQIISKLMRRKRLSPQGDESTTCRQASANVVPDTANKIHGNGVTPDQGSSISAVTPTIKGNQTIDQVLASITAPNGTKANAPTPVFEMHLKQHHFSKHNSTTIVIEMPMPVGVVANTVTLTLLGKNFEKSAGSGFLAAVERVDIIGFPLRKQSDALA
jgi:hypothetical protein